MKLKRLILAAVALLSLSPMAKADKGMWLLNELKKENIQRMKELGFTLNPEALFNNDAPSIANAVVIFGRGCTGITTSNEGLIFTNHHCGYDAIQSQSTVQHDYLRDGFVSYNKSQELPIPGLSVSYLNSIKDVTAEVEAAVAGISDELLRISKINQTLEELAKPYNKNKNTKAQVYPFYENNVYYLIIYDVFTDVRMVFAPPSSMGKFGGDTDNWMWPRHTNDFAVFRAYADAKNRPADYSPKNKPYRPKYFAKVSLKGVKENDYAMTIGFPGSTDRYLSSWGVDNLIKYENEPRILVRGLKQDVWLKHMKADQGIKIQYASKYAQSSNYWKNSIGMNKGLKRLNVIEEKRKIEKEFAQWANATPERKVKYGFVLDSLRLPLADQGRYRKNYTILTEALSGTELRALVSLPEKAKDFDVEARYKDFNPKVAKETLPVMLRAIKENVDPEFQPTIIAAIEQNFAGDFNKFADYLYENSVVVDRNRVVKAMEDYPAFRAAIGTDPAMMLVADLMQSVSKVGAKIGATMGQYLKGRRLFFAGLREMWPDRALPSDANFTMRMSYGSVKGYKPFDAATYDYYTTEAGIFEKQDPDSHEFAVQPEILKQLGEKDFGDYADADGTLHLCFLSDNDITGGNSGSPVFGKDGHLIGLAFDGNWEAMSGDIEFEPNLQRTISVDIRYVLWAIHKWGKADNIIKELELVR